MSKFPLAALVLRLHEAEERGDNHEANAIARNLVALDNARIRVLGIPPAVELPTHRAPPVQRILAVGLTLNEARRSAAHILNEEEKHNA